MEPPPPRQPIYQWHEYVENLEDYCSGGYHPVEIGDSYARGRYRVVHKLGFGSYSTVWLARDTFAKRYVALKIVMATFSHDSSESRILRHLSDSVEQKNAIGSGFVTHLLDEFTIDGPNGQHLCLVTEPARRSLAGSKEAPPWIFPLPIARAIAAQVILGLQVIHNSGIVHGDLHVGNILFTLPQIDSLSVGEIYQRFHTPRETQIQRMDGAALGPEVPSHSVMPAQIGISASEVSDPRIRIVDFGEALLLDDIQSQEDMELQTAVLYVPPEAIFAKSLIGLPADIWSLACSIYEIMGERTLFEGLIIGRENMVAEMVSCLGPLPQDWWNIWQTNEEFVENGVWRTEPEPLSLHERMNYMGRKGDPDFSTAEREALEKMLQSMLQYEPSKRATIEDVGQSEWMRHWGVPSLEVFKIGI
ncbi:MAG: hypothetical protein Q9219_006508 [cf. Caloplaca sp. 3 TL-2023]